MPAAKAKSHLKVVPKVKAKAKTVKAKPKAKAPVKAKASSKSKLKVVAAVKPVAPKKTFTSKPSKESVFARLLREKAERHAGYMQQNQGDQHPHDQQMPSNHARFSKFAGPRRRAS